MQWSAFFPEQQSDGLRYGSIHETVAHGLDVVANGRNLLSLVERYCSSLRSSGLPHGSFELDVGWQTQREIARSQYGGQQTIDRGFGLACQSIHFRKLRANTVGLRLQLS